MSPFRMGELFTSTSHSAGTRGGGIGLHLS